MVKTNEIKLGQCPYCNTLNYSRGSLEIEEDFVFCDNNCDNCGEDFREYFGLDEVRFKEKISTDEEVTYGDYIIYNNTLIKDEKETLLGAMNLLVDREGDTKDYTRIFNILYGRLNEE